MMETGSQTWSLEFPPYHTLHKFSSDQQQAVKEVLLNVRSFDSVDSVEVNLLFRKYKYVLLNGMKVASSTPKQVLHPSILG